MHQRNRLCRVLLDQLQFKKAADQLGTTNERCRRNNGLVPNGSILMQLRSRWMMVMTGFAFAVPSNDSESAADTCRSSCHTGSSSIVQKNSLPQFLAVKFSQMVQAD